MRRCLRGGAGALLLVAGLAAAAEALKPEVGYRVVPADYGILCEEVTLTTADSLALRGWFFPAQDTAGIANEMVGRVIPVPPERRPAPRPYRPADAPPGPAVILCDGDAGNMAYAILYAYELFTRGFHVLTFDWRGFGESDPWPMEQDRLVCSEFLTDYDAAIDHVKSRPEVDPQAIGLLGFSTGAYLSLAAAAGGRDVSALVGRAMITSFDDLLPILAELDPQRPWRAPEDYPRDLLPIHAAGRLEVPVLLVVGEEDERTPPWMSQRVFDRLGGPGELWVVPGAGHGGRTAPERVAFPEFFERAAAFYRLHLTGSGPRGAGAAD